jgi:hypothetical protein
MAADILARCRACQNCARAKVHRHVRAPLESFDLPPRKFSHIHVDLVGPLPASQQGFTHLFTAVDRSTRWAEAVPLSDTTAAACADALFQGWIGRFGVPDVITSDRGPQFSSDAWYGMCKRLGIRHIMTTAYHPQANGMVERMHRRLKEAMRARQGDDWYQHLPWVLLGLRAAPKEDSAVSAAELALGTPLVLPGELMGAPPATEADLVRELRSDLISFAPLPVRKFPVAKQDAAVPEALLQAAYVYVRSEGAVPPLAAGTRVPSRSLGRAPSFSACSWAPGRTASPWTG